MDVITSLDDLRTKIDECNEMLTTDSDDAMRRLFSTFRMDFSADAPVDAFSSEYRQFQLMIYQTVACRPYKVDNERSSSRPKGKRTIRFPTT